MRQLLLFILFSLPMLSYAQSDPEYLMEVGAGIGMMSYEGDFNGNITKCGQPSAAVILRRNLNPRQGFRFQLGYGKLKASSTDVATAYPGYTTKQYDDNNGVATTFSHTLVDLNAVYEYNFWPYGTGRDYRGAKRITPFVFFGLGATYVNGNDNNTFTANVPLGIGVKYKIGDRLNLNVDWAMHFSMSDKLDGIKDPYLVQSHGIFKNTDCYSVLQLSLTYSFKAKCKVCHNQDE